MDNSLSKSYYKIKDVAEIVGVNQSTLRFWESQFEEITPRRSQFNQRYYSPSDIETLHIIKFLIKDKGLKIEAAKEYLSKNRKNLSRKLEAIDKLKRVREELNEILKSLNLRGQQFGINSEP